MKAFTKILFVLSLTAFSVGDGITVAEEESPDPIVGDTFNHRGQLFSPGPESPSVTVVAASATYPAGTSFSTDFGETFTSTTDDPLGPFSGQSVMYRGRREGGDTQVYRYRLDFAQEVTLDSIVFEGAAWLGSAIHLLDEQDIQLKSIVSLPGGNSFQRHVLVASGITGRTFFLEETNGATEWRYRSKIEVNAVTSTPDDPAWLIPILNLLLDDDSEQASENAIP